MPPYISGYINPCFCSFCLKPTSIPELHHLLEILCSRRVPSFPRLRSSPCQNRGSCFTVSSMRNRKGRFPRNSNREEWLFLPQSLQTTRRENKWSQAGFLSGFSQCFLQELSLSVYVYFYINTCI